MVVSPFVVDTFYICNFKNNIKAAIKYLFPIGIGVIVSIILFSKIISLCLDKYYVITMLFFIGLIIGGFSFIVNKVNKKDYYISIISFIIFFLIHFVLPLQNYSLSSKLFSYIATCCASCFIFSIVCCSVFNCSSVVFLYSI